MYKISYDTLLKVADLVDKVESIGSHGDVADMESDVSSAQEKAKELESLRNFIREQE